MDLLARNPFRLANLSSLAGLDEVKTRLYELDLCLRAGMALAIPLQAELGVPEDLSALRSQVGSLAAEPGLQCAYRMLWPPDGWPEEARTSEELLARFTARDPIDPGQDHRTFLARLVRFSRAPNLSDAIEVMRYWSEWDEDRLWEAVEMDQENSGFWSEGLARVEGLLVEVLLRGASRLRLRGELEEAPRLLQEMWEFWHQEDEIQGRIERTAVEFGNTLEEAVKAATSELDWEPGFQNPVLREEQQLRVLIGFLRETAGQALCWEQALREWNDARGVAMQDHAYALAASGRLAEAKACLEEALRLEISPHGREILTEECRKIEEAMRSPTQAGRKLRVVETRPEVWEAGVNFGAAFDDSPLRKGCGSVLSLALLFIVGSFVSNVLGAVFGSSSADSASSPPFVSAPAAEPNVDLEPVSPPGPELISRPEPRGHSELEEPTLSRRERARRLKARHGEIGAELESMKSELSLQEMEIARLESELETRRSELDLAKSRLDASDSFVLDSFNDDVDEFNDLLGRCRQEIEDFNLRVDAYIEKLERLREVEADLDEMGLLRR